ncbi:MAG: PilZ domain-containing protein [Candidatus Omnitrophica bacterium]|nr:PilZ domain-containing protein [Candidatus Omnitrophota bacterium]
MTEDRRCHKRYKAFVHPPRSRDLSGGKVDIQDISFEGLHIAIDKELGKGETVDLEIFIPQDDIPMFISGVVAWSKQDAAIAARFNAGLKLLKINKCDKDRLRTYIHTHLLGL